MQKKLIALAVAAAISTPAFADVTIYGKVNMDVEHVSSNDVGVDASGAKVSGSQNRIVSNATRLGFKGSEDLGDGLSAIYQYEVQMDGDGNGGNGLGNGTRNSQIGLKGGLGQAFLGVWDTPFKQSHNAIEQFDNTTFASATDIIGRLPGAVAGTGVVGSGLSMVTRLKDSVNYYTPDMGGFQVMAAYGVDDAQKTTTVAPGPVAAASNQNVISLSGAFNNDMFYAALAYQKMNDTDNTGALKAGDVAKGTRLVGAYKINSTSQVGVTLEKIGVTPNGGSTVSRNAVEVSGKTGFGQSTVGLILVKAGSLTNTTATGAKQVSLRYGYNLSKKTELYAMASQVKNDTNGSYGFSASSSVTNSRVGATETGLGVGMIMSF